MVLYISVTFPHFFRTFQGGGADAMVPQNMPLLVMKEYRYLQWITLNIRQVQYSLVMSTWYRPRLVNVVMPSTTSTSGRRPVLSCTTRRPDTLNCSRLGRSTWRTHQYCDNPTYNKAQTRRHSVEHILPSQRANPNPIPESNPFQNLTCSSLIHRLTIPQIS